MANKALLEAGNVLNESGTASGSGSEKVESKTNPSGHTLRVHWLIHRLSTERILLASYFLIRVVLILFLCYFTSLFNHYHPHAILPPPPPPLLTPTPTTTPTPSYPHPLPLLPHHPHPLLVTGNKSVPMLPKVTLQRALTRHVVSRHDNWCFLLPLLSLVLSLFSPSPPLLPPPYSPLLAPSPPLPSLTPLLLTPRLLFSSSPPFRSLAGTGPLKWSSARTTARQWTCGLVSTQ